MPIDMVIEGLIAAKKIAAFVSRETIVGTQGAMQFGALTDTAASSIWEEPQARRIR